MPHIYLKRRTIAGLILERIGLGVFVLSLGVGLNHACTQKVRPGTDENSGKGMYALMLCVTPATAPTGDLIVMEAANNKRWQGRLIFRNRGGGLYCTLDDHYLQRPRGAEIVYLRPDTTDHDITQLDVWPAQPGMKITDNTFRTNIRTSVPLHRAFNEFVYAVLADSHRLYIGQPDEQSATYAGF
ncbi:hypothetical protein FJZ23_02660 [Candidatus Parcubacteria bacterium]|nr:hypothetical protein [Candidatus Parcubacteria bacterium]